MYYVQNQMIRRMIHRRICPDFQPAQDVCTLKYENESKRPVLCRCETTPMQVGRAINSKLRCGTQGEQSNFNIDIHLGAAPF